MNWGIRPARADLTALMTGIERQADARKVAFQRALFSVLINCGPRAQELLDMKVPHFSASDKTLLIAHGKGEKPRLLHSPLATISAIQEWLYFRGEVRHDWLWSITVTRRLGYDGIRALIEEAKARAGLADRNNIKCHAMRRAFATRMMTRGSSIKATQAALGHSLSETTFNISLLANRRCG